MHKWILSCLAYRKTIFSIAFILLIMSLFGIRHLSFDYKMSVTPQKPSANQTVLVVAYDKNILNQQHLSRLALVQAELSQIKSVKKVTSLYSVPNFRRYLDEHVISSVIQSQPFYTQNDLKDIKSDALDNRLFVGKFINKSADLMIFYLTIPNDELGGVGFKIRNEIQQVLNKNNQYFSRIFQMGFTEISYTLIKKARHDFILCIPIMFLLMAILFGWLFRNVFLFVLPFSTSVFGILCALGTMGWLNIPVSPLFIAAIVLTLAIGVAESAHIIHAYQKSKRLDPLASQEAHRAFLLKAIFLPFLLAVFTALLGFMLDVLSFVPVIVDAAYALALCLVFNTSVSIFISPLLLPYLKVQETQDRAVFAWLAKNLVRLNGYFVLRKKWVFFLLIVLGLMGLFAFNGLNIETLPFSLLKKTDPMMRDVYFMDKNIAPTNFIQVNVYSEKKDVFLEPTYLQKVLDCEQALLKIPGTAYVYSISDVIASANQIFLFNTKKFFEIPKDKKVLDVFYQTLKKEAHLERDMLINKDANQLSMFINYSMYSSRLLEPYKAAIENTLKNAFHNTSLCFAVIDTELENLRIINNLLILQIISIFSIYLICFFTVGFMFRSIKAGLISIIPNVVPLCFISIAQYGLNVPISAFSVILYSIVVGLSMDETIHFFYAFREQYKTLQDKPAAIEAALKSQVVPVTVASVAITISWLVLLFSQFLPMVQLGLLSGIGIVTAWFSDLVITPFFLQRNCITKKINGR